MFIAYLCVLIAVFLPYIWVGYVKFSGKGYDNSKPREFLEKLDGKAKRANYAHLNAFEAFPPFAAGVIMANMSGVAEQTITILSVSFIIFRVLHGVCYILDQATVRSVMWFGGFLCVVGLFILSLKALS